MNLRQKFIWNLVVVISFIVIGWNSYFQIYQHTDITKAYNKFNNEEVGTDKELQEMIVSLEQNLNARQNLKFNLKENPLELTKVIRLDGSNTSLTGQKGIDCTGLMSNGDGTYTAMCIDRIGRHAVVVGDSISKGIVTNITGSKVVIYKDEKELIFNIGK
tara:strand:+ start:163 stop:642 length:480 start_codon:yes stop_codon:yes gene_type:complete